MTVAELLSVDIEGSRLDTQDIRGIAVQVANPHNGGLLVGAIEGLHPEDDGVEVRFSFGPDEDRGERGRTYEWSEWYPNRAVTVLPSLQQSPLWQRDTVAEVEAALAVASS